MTPSTDSWLRRKALICAVALIFVFLLLYRPLQSDVSSFASPVPALSHLSPQRHLDDSQVLQSLNLSSYFEYRCRTLDAVQTPGLERSSLQSVQGSLLDRRTIVQNQTLGSFWDNFASHPPHCGHETVHVPPFVHPSEEDTSALLIGASTTLERLNATAPQWARWLANSSASVVVIIQEDNKNGIITQNYNSSAWREVEGKLVDLDINATLVPYLALEPTTHSHLDGEQVRHLGIVEALNIYRTPQHKWFVIIDDDTFFTSLPALQRALAPFDPSAPQYLGALTENFAQLQLYGRMAYGGAGIVLSAPVVSFIAEHVPRCNFGLPGGDMLIAHCIAQMPDAPPLTPLPGLNQLDLRGDASGWFQAGPHPLLSLHHFNSWYRLPIAASHRVADVAGPDSWLQRYRFAPNAHAYANPNAIHNSADAKPSVPAAATDHALLLVNGHSIQAHPPSSPPPDLAKVEPTWPHVPGQFNAAFGDMRPPLTEGVNKTTWHFATSYVPRGRGIWDERRSGDDTVEVRQFYVRREANETLRAAGAMDSVFEIVWKARATGLR